jgi:hypothetical protein
MIKKKNQGKKYTYVCRKHKYTKKCVGGGLCPICREKLKLIAGDRWRIHRNGDFDRKERKTRNLLGQKPIITERQRKLKMDELLKNRRKSLLS